MEKPPQAQADPRPMIEPIVKGPYYVTNLTDFRNSRGEPTSTSAETYLCRCRASKNKPFCSGAHWDIDFKDGKN